MNNTPKTRIVINWPVTTAFLTALSLGMAIIIVAALTNNAC